MENVKICKQCGQIYEGDEVEGFFRKYCLSIDKQKKYRNICDGCQQNNKDNVKKKNRPLEKARRTLYTHADKYIKAELAQNRDDFALKFRWDLEQMAHDIAHAFQNGCPYCRQQFADMPHGLADVTLDIISPNDFPFYGINTRWVCATCNREKQKTPPNLWGAKLRAWDKWRRHQKSLELNPFAGLPLFELGNLDANRL